MTVLPSPPDEPGDADAENRVLEAALAVDAGRGSWATLILTAETHLYRDDWLSAEAAHVEAWRAAGDRLQQAATLHHMGRHLYFFNDKDSAAGRFELARALRRGFADPRVVASSERALQLSRDKLAYDAIVLTGGAGRRQGGRQKAELRVGNWPLADHVLLAVAGAQRRVVAGPRRRGLAEPVFCREDPPGSGPVAALAAAVEHTEAALIVVLAADLPHIAAQLDTLRMAVQLFPERDASVLVDPTGRVNYLAAVWQRQSLVAALKRASSLPERDAHRVSSLYEGATVHHLPDFDGDGADCDTPNDLAEADRRVRQPRPLLANSDEWLRRLTVAPLPATPLAWPGLELDAPS